MRVDEPLNSHVSDGERAAPLPMILLLNVVLCIGKRATVKHSGWSQGVNAEAGEKYIPISETTYSTAAYFMTEPFYVVIAFVGAARRSPFVGPGARRRREV